MGSLNYLCLKLSEQEEKGYKACTVLYLEYLIEHNFTPVPMSFLKGT